MLQLPDHITIKTAAPYVIGAYLGVWLIATVYLNILDSQVLRLKKELSLLADRVSKERSPYSLVMWLTITAVGVGVVFLSFTYSSTSDESLKDAMSAVIYLYIAIWTLSFGYLAYIGNRLFKLYKEMQSLSETIINGSNS